MPSLPGWRLLAPVPDASFANVFAYTGGAPAVVTMDAVSPPPPELKAGGGASSSVRVTLTVK